ncbi:hypothetical protein [Bradyrhizobium sp. LA7.1]|uniref:hypothetical protein n=1 Tax=Bradyrhizobium sp. LA7.1 TaxID=3156324 RepID=UPI00339168CC
MTKILLALLAHALLIGAASAQSPRFNDASHKRIAEDVRPPARPDPFADAQQCSEAALNSYALSSAEPAEKIAETAFRKCADKWREAFEPVGQQMDASPALKEAQDTCIKKLGPSSCPAPLPSIVHLMDAAQRTFQNDAVTKVFDIRAKATGK